MLLVNHLMLWLDATTSANLGAFVLIALIGGVVRGATGFGGALVMILPLAAIYSMPQAIAISISLELFGPLFLIWAAVKRVYSHALASQILKQFIFWSVLGLPIGLIVQGSLDSNLVGMIASTAIAFMVLMMLIGAHRSLPRVSSRVARGLGLACGSLIALTGIGGPLAATYFLNEIKEPALMRSMMHLYATAMSVATISLMLGFGFVGMNLLPALAVGLPIYIGATLLGQHLTSLISAERLRLVILLFILASSGVYLLRFLPLELI